ncbi:MAG: DUF3530 family protein [Cocleimonas sp.]
MRFIIQFRTLLLVLLVSLTQTIALATDKDKEKRWEVQISDSLLDGEVIKLSDGKIDFLAIDTRAEEPSDVGIIIIHGIGVHPDWSEVIQPLRVELAVEGWNTLSLQMPVLNNEAKPRDYEPLMKEVPARIDAGIRQMAKEGAKKVVIIAHSMGAQMTNYYLAHKKVYKEAQTDTPIVGYIGIGMNTGNTKYLKKIKIPVLDLYGKKDLPGVLESAPMRVNASSHNKKYKQQMVKGANHFFVDKEEELINAVKEALISFK